MLRCRYRSTIVQATSRKKNFFCDIAFWRGILGGYSIPQYRKKNWQTPKYRVKNRRKTDTAFMIGHVYLKLYLSRVFVYLQYVCTRNQPQTLRDFNGRTIEKPSHWMLFQFRHRLCNHSPLSLKS